MLGNMKKKYLSRYEKFDNLKTDEKYCCFIHTVDNVNYTVWVANSESAKKIDAWLCEK